MVRLKIGEDRASRIDAARLVSVLIIVPGREEGMDRRESSGCTHRCFSRIFSESSFATSRSLSNAVPTDSEIYCSLYGITDS